MLVNNQRVSSESQPYIIAELSANHGGDLGRAKKSIESAAKAGVSAVKLQTYTPDTMTIDSNRSDFKISQGIWAGRTLYDLYSEAYTPFEWHKELFKHAQDNAVTIFSTPFDETAVDLLEELNAPAYKIASFEIVDIPLIRYVARKNKPIFMSTGMASESEIKSAVKAIREETDAKLLLFHCVSSYPATTEDSNLKNLVWLKNNFDVLVGLSDHTTNNVAALTAIGMGAVAIEKHFKLDERDCGPDSSFSLNIKELQELVHQCNQAWAAKGSIEFARAESERENMVFRRSLYFINRLQAGQIISEQDIRRIRPGYGLSPEHYYAVIGKRVRKSVDIGEAVSWDLLEEAGQIAAK